MVTGVAVADDTGTPVQDVTLYALATGIGPVRGTGAAMPLTIRLHGTRVRIDFDGPRGEDGYLLSHGDSRAWLVNERADVALPIHSTARTMFRADPTAPCAQIGARCEPGQHEVIAGQLVQAWRYRDADGRGPDGTESGTLWVEPRSGLVLAFRGRVAGRDQVKELRVTSMSRDALDASLFDLPRTLEQVYPRAPEPASTEARPD